MEQLTELLTKLAAELGTTAEHLWSILLEQVNVEIILCNLWMDIWLFGGGVVIVCSILLFIISFLNDWEESSIVSAIFFFTTLLIAGVGYCEVYSELLTLTNNPEYWALKEILSALG